MPKRDERYMEGRRELIARAALECILEHGVGATSTRDVCVRAGISMGALYAHYQTREELIVAAIMLEPPFIAEPVGSWHEYEQIFREMIDQSKTNERFRQYMRFVYEYVAENASADQMPAGVAEHFDRNVRFFRESLRAIHETGEVALPLGLESTTQLHLQMLVGAIYMLVAHKRLNHRDVRNRLIESLAYTVGHAAPAFSAKARPSSRRVSTTKCG